ncbi:MAG TPA: hypothetical protein VLO07_01760, partial [Thermoanaerobaculia bacterium]|nr:hypothetical protein [Thermoanaerobaculia bacterium]
MTRKKPAQPVGGDIDWFVIPIEAIRRWAIALLVILVAGVVGYLLYSKARRSPEEKAVAEIATATTLLTRASAAAGNVRPG